VLARWKGVKLYLDIRDLFALNLQEIQVSLIFKKIGAPFMFWMERMAFRYANHINIVSGGFRSYLASFPNARITEFTNGIDDIFLANRSSQPPVQSVSDVKTILYAGNIGEGQGLHKIVPDAALQLGPGYRILIYGDGAMRVELEERLSALRLNNVEIHPPVKRSLLIQEYLKADFLFLHLNDYDAFKKVLPSKIFELSSFDKPILAGVGGYPAEFIRTEVRGSHVFNPCDAGAMVEGILKFQDVGHIDRSEFLEKFSRSRITLDMSKSILSYL
jgi:glycosyltransferase involved in cell wall biosynthesis